MALHAHGRLAAKLQSPATGLPAWGSGQPGQVGNQAALTVEPVPGVRLVTLSLFPPLPFFAFGMRAPRWPGIGAVV